MGERAQIEPSAVSIDELRPVRAHSDSGRKDAEILSRGQNRGEPDHGPGILSFDVPRDEPTRDRSDQGEGDHFRPGERGSRASDGHGLILVADEKPRVTRVSQALVGLLLQTPPHNASHVKRSVVGKKRPIGLGAYDRREDVGHVVAFERLGSRQSLEQATPIRPDVGALVDHLAPGLFRAHVGCGS